MVVVSTLRLARTHPILGGRQVVCPAGATLYDLERVLDPFGRDPHSVIGSSCIGASVVGGVCNNSGSALVRRGPAYTELALFARLDAEGTLRLVNALGIDLGDSPEAILSRLDGTDIDDADVDPSPGAASDGGYSARVREVEADTPARVNADPGRLPDASGCAGRLAVFAVRLDTFPRPEGTEVLYVGTNDPEALRLLRRRLLTELDPLPILGEYVHRGAFEFAACYGRDTRLFIERFGTAQMHPGSSPPWAGQTRGYGGWASPTSPTASCRWRDGSCRGGFLRRCASFATASSITWSLRSKRRSSRLSGSSTNASAPRAGSAARRGKAPRRSCIALR